MNKLQRRFWSIVFLLPLLVFAEEKPLNIAVASNFVPTMKKIVERYQENTSQKINLLSGSTGKHYLQITYGAPIDLFFGADQRRPNQLVKDGKARDQFTYAIGQLAYYYPSYSGEAIDFRVAIQLPVTRVSLGNPKHAPYGMAGQQVLEKFDLWHGAKTTYVFGENVSQSYTIVASKAVDAGFVAYSQLKQLPSIKPSQYWLVPQTAYQPIKQNAVVIAPSARVEAFLQFFQSETVESLILADGYKLP